MFKNNLGQIFVKFIKESDYLEKGDNRYYITLLIYLCISVETFYQRIKLFASKMKELRGLLTNESFIEFIDDIFNVKKKDFVDFDRNT